MSCAICFFVTVLGCVFGLQLAQAAFITTTPSHLLNYYPSRSYLGYPKPSYMSDVTHQKLQAIARQFGLCLTDTYQWYSLINMYANLSTDQDISMMKQLADIYNRELYYSGLYYYHRFCYNNDYSGAYSTIAAAAPLIKREPQLTLSIGNDIYSNLSAAVNNLAHGIAYYMPQTTASMRNMIRDTVNNNLPREAMNDAENLSYSLYNNMRSMLSDIMGSRSR